MLALFLAAATPQFVLSPRSAEQWVAFTLTPGNQIRFAMQLDGRPAAAVLDTGVSVSVMTREFAKRARIRERPLGAATAIGGMVAVGSAVTRSLAIGGLTRTGGQMVVATIGPETVGNDAVDLLIGRDVLAGQALDLDFEHRRFRLLPSGAMPFTGAIAPLAVPESIQLYLSEATVAERRVAPMIVDTGDGTALTLSRAAWTAAGPPAVPVTTGIAYGLGGVVVSEIAVLPSVRVGGAALGEVEARIEAPGGFSDAAGAAGRIGTGLLQRFRVLLDPTAGRMVLSPLPAAAGQVLRSTSGLLLRYGGGRATVVHVMRGSPAAAAGWRGGEAICAVDGQPVPAMPDAAFGGWTVGAPGRVVTLRLCDGTLRPLTLAQFY